MLNAGSSLGNAVASVARPPITGSGLADLLSCERRFANDLLSEATSRDPVNAFVEMLWREGTRHEAAIIADLGDGVVDLRDRPMSERVAATLSAIGSSAPLIVGARLELGDRVGMPDLLMLADGVYHAGDIKAGSPFAPNGVDPKLLYGAQVGFYARLLADGGWGDGSRCFLIGSDGAIVWFDVHSIMRGGGSSLSTHVDGLTEKARAIRDGSVATSPAACAMCGLCVWKSACKAELSARDDVTLIAGVGRSVRELISGIATTVEGLAAIPIEASMPAVPGVGAARLARFVERARSLSTPGAQPYATRPLGLAPRARELHLDLETDPTDGNLVYLHGIRERIREESGTQERYVHFLAVDETHERDAFAGAIEFLSADPEALITTYSAFERSTYRMLQRRYPDVATVEQIDELFSMPRSIDLYFGAVLPATVWPLHSLGLKAIARFLGFEWRDDEASGAASISWFVEYAATRDPALLERILQYNSDDCSASMVVFDGLLTLPVRGPLEWPPPRPLPSSPSVSGGGK